jgi:hypothetical protein
VNAKHVNRQNNTVFERNEAAAEIKLSERFLKAVERSADAARKTGKPVAKKSKPDMRNLSNLPPQLEELSKRIDRMTTKEFVEGATEHKAKLRGNNLDPASRQKSARKRIDGDTNEVPANVSLASISAAAMKLDVPVPSSARNQMDLSVILENKKGTKKPAQQLGVQSWKKRKLDLVAECEARQIAVEANESCKSLAEKLKEFEGGNVVIQRKTAWDSISNLVTSEWDEAGARIDSDEESPEDMMIESQEENDAVDEMEGVPVNDTAADSAAANDAAVEYAVPQPSEVVPAALGLMCVWD